MLSQVSAATRSKLSAHIARTMGLSFPPERWEELKRGLAGAARESGFEDAAKYVDWTLSVPPSTEQIQVLASHLTIGETYFFRDQKTLNALAHTILPELIRSRRGRDQRLRIWSSACSSGEEPYTLAMLLHQLLPDPRDWQVSIMATDINPHFLRKATAGSYSEWSFRNAPPWLKQRYFKRTAEGRYAIIPEIRKLVTFTHLNLVENDNPLPAINTNALDIIFCRNVLMYFTPSQVDRVICRLSRALVEGGWLAVGPSETSKALFPRFVSVNFPDAILFRKGNAPVLPSINESSPRTGSAAPAAHREAAALQPALAKTQATLDVLATAQTLYRQGHYAQAADTLLATCRDRQTAPAALSLLTRALANQGRLADALTWCKRWIAADKVDPAGHYLHAMVVLEQGDAQRARASLQRAVYLDYGFVLAHFALGNLARRCGKNAEAVKHFSNVQHLLRAFRADDPLPEADGLTAGRLAETLASLTNSMMAS
ncbi:CheR family methyltransferase [Polaromonas sp. C04]|uniref:CheR family methyltransferase n=1 Tax=Polaromonas sp. C04 TaxID=1945857 RepID=UPI000987B728|nr:CheR family methyltransferase [Polaromonas sp. C04]OOG57983.1 chemotaxis protein CheR [Polaromonas sp. C04]